MLPQTIFEIGPNGKFTYTNRHGLASFGYTQEDIDAGLNPINLFTPEDRERAAENMMKRLQGTKINNNEYTIMGKNGGLFNVLVYSSSIMQDGKPVGPRIVAIDISGRKAAEKALSESEEKYRLLADNVTDNIWILSVKTLKMIYTSPSCERITGFTPQEIMSRPAKELIVPQSLKILNNLFKEIFELKIEDSKYPNWVKVIELEQYHKNGSTVWVEITAKMLRDDAGDITGVLGLHGTLANGRRPGGPAGRIVKDKEPS